jgi:uncharacterized protein YndB with AHSA1/START domain
MTQATETRTGSRPPSLVLERVFNAPRALVFQAWSSADHVKRWFSPVNFTVPEAEIDFRAGGVMRVKMAGPGGYENWNEGHFVEVKPQERIVFAGDISVGGEVKFTARTTVTFTDEDFGFGPCTRMKVVQDYVVYDQAFMTAVNGAPEGWRTTLDKLEREVARIRDVAAGRTVVHDAFTLSRTYDATPAQVFHALTDMDAKAKWFVGGAAWTPVERYMDVRPGGRERAKGRWPTGMVTTFDAVYFDVVPDRRLVYTYDLYIDDRKISVSLATAEIAKVASGTTLTITEQGAFLDGYDDAGARQHGTGALMDRIGESLKG